jgi:hypothetical protein
MTKRIKVAALLAPHGIYRRTPLAVTGYKPTERSRWAVVRTGDAAAWLLIHHASGAGVGSLLPVLPRKLTLAEMLAAAAAFDAATHLDWSAFDALPAVTPETTAEPRLGNPSPATLRTVQAMRELARLAICGAVA